MYDDKLFDEVGCEEFYDDSCIVTEEMVLDFINGELQIAAAEQE